MVAIEEDGVAGGEVAFVPAAGAQTPVGDGVVAPQDGGRIEMRKRRRPAWGSRGTADDGRRDDASSDVRDDRCEAEREPFDPHRQKGSLGLVSEDDGDEGGLHRRAEEKDEKVAHFEYTIAIES